jgi:hypothetical protein
MRCSGRRVGVLWAAFALSALLSNPAHANSCGDGIVSPTEECDPSAPGNDNCCDPVLCMWTPAGDPDPQNMCSGAPVCQYDVCDGSGGCTTGNVAAGTTCDDGDPCTDQTECDGNGACGGGVNLCGDAGVSDAALEDATVPDAAGEDAGPVDAGSSDGGPPDAALEDGALIDSDLPDVVWHCDVRGDVPWWPDGSPRADAEDGYGGSGRPGCSCRAGAEFSEVPSSGLLLVLLVIGLLVALRRCYGR